MFWIRNYSHIAADVVVVVLLLLLVVLIGAKSSKTQGFNFLDRIGMKFGTIVLRVNVHPLVESNF